MKRLLIMLLLLFCAISSVNAQGNILKSTYHERVNQIERTAILNQIERTERANREQKKIIEDAVEVFAEKFIENDKKSENNEEDNNEEDVDRKSKRKYKKKGNHNKDSYPYNENKTDYSYGIHEDDDCDSDEDDDNFDSVYYDVYDSDDDYDYDGVYIQREAYANDRYNRQEGLLENRISNLDQDMYDTEKIRSQKEMPYKKLLFFTKNDFIRERFKYKRDHNQWMLIKKNGLNTFLNALNSSPRPHRDDYAIYVQGGIGDEIASINVEFINNNIYHHILSIAKDHGRALIETTSGSIVKTQFVLDGYDISLEMERLKTSVTILISDIKMRDFDDSHNIYTYRIFTGVEAISPSIEKAREKESKRRKKGKKRSKVESLMF